MVKHLCRHLTLHANCMQLLEDFQSSTGACFSGFSIFAHLSGENHDFQCNSLFYLAAGHTSPSAAPYSGGPLGDPKIRELPPGTLLGRFLPSFFVFFRLVLRSWLRFLLVSAKFHDFSSAPIAWSEPWTRSIFFLQLMQRAKVLHTPNHTYIGF